MSKEQDTLTRTVAEAIRRATLLFQRKAGNQSSTGRASSTQSGLVPPVPDDPTMFLNGAAPPEFTPVVVVFHRTTQVIATAALADLAVEDGTVAMPDTVAALLTIQSDAACWVRLYTDASSQAADAARVYGVQPTAGTGVLAEFVLPGAAVIPTSPVPWLSNDESIPTNRVFYTIQNRSGAMSSVTVTLGYGSVA